MKEREIGARCNQRHAPIFVETSNDVILDDPVSNISIHYAHDASNEVVSQLQDPAILR